MQSFTSKKLMLLVVVIIGMQIPTNAATITSTTGGGVWSAGATWVGGVAPLTTDDVIIDGPVTLSVAAQCASLTINATKSLTTNTFLLTITGDFTNNGTFTSTTGGITLAGTANQTLFNDVVTTGTFRMEKTGGIAFCFGNISAAALTINGIGGTLNLGGSTRTHTFSGDITLTQGTLRGGMATINANSSSTTAWTRTSGTFLGDTSTVIFGGAAQTIGSGTAFNNITLGGSAGKIFAPGTTNINGILTLTTGFTHTYNGGLAYGSAAGLVYNTPSARTITTNEWPNTFLGTGGVTIANTGVITGNFRTLGNSTTTNVPLTVNLSATLSLGATGLTLHGNLTNNGTITTTGDWNITGPGTQNIGNLTIAGFATLYVTKTGGVATMLGSLGVFDFSMNGVGGTLDLGIGLTHTIRRNTTITNGTLLGNQANLILGGNFTITAPGVFTGGAVNIETTCNCAPAYPAFSTTGNFILNNPNNFPTLAGNVTVGNLDLRCGIVIGSNTLTVNGNLLLNTGGNLFGGTGTIVVNGTSATAWSGPGTFTRGTSTVIFSGGAQTIRNTQFFNLTLSGTGGKTFSTGTTEVSGLLTIANGNNANTYNGTFNATGSITYNINGVSRTTSSTEWSSSSSGSVIITGTGTVILDGEKQPTNLTIDAGATLNTNNNGLTLHGSLTINGTFNAGSSNITLVNANNQLISGFTTTGTFIINKSGNTATMAGPMSVRNLTLSSSQLNLGTGLTHTVTGNVTLNSVLNGGSSTLNVAGNWSGSAFAFTAGTSTVVFTGAAQSVSANSFNNLTLKGSLNKTFGTTLTVNGILSIEETASVIVTTGTVVYGSNATLQYNKPAAYTTTAEEFGTTFNGLGGVIIANTGTILLNNAKTIDFALTINTGATIDLGLGLNHTSRGLVLGGAPSVFGEYGGTGSGAANIRAVFFTANTGKIISSTSTATWNTAAATTDWNNTANWLEATIPNATLNTIIPGGGTQPTLTAAATCRNLIVQSGATITTAGFQLTLNGDFINSGTVVFGSSPVTIEGALTQSIAAISTTGTLTVNKTLGTATLTGSLTAGSLLVSGSAGTIFNLGNVTHTIAGNITVNAGATLDPSTSTVNLGGNLSNSGTITSSSFVLNLTGTATQSIGAFSTTGAFAMLKTGGIATFTGNVTIGSLTINGLGGTLHLGTGRSHIINPLGVTLTAGQLNADNSTLTMNGSTPTTWTGDGMLFNPGTSSVVINSNLTMNATGTCEFNNLDFAHIGGNTITSNLFINGILRSNAKQAFNGTVTYGVSGGLIYSTGPRYFPGNEWPATFTGTGGVTINLGPGGSVIDFNQSRIMGPGANLTINGSLFRMGGANTTLTLEGNLINTSAPVDMTSIGTIILSGSANQSIGSLPNYGSFIINKTGGTATMTSGIGTNVDVTVTAGTLNLGSALTHTVNNINLNGGTLNANTSTIALSGNYINGGGTLSNTAFNLNLLGTTNQSISGYSSTGNITMLKTGGTATFGGNVSAAGLTINGNGGTLNLGNALTHTFTGVITRTIGTLTSTNNVINLSASTPFSGIGGTFTLGTSTINYTGSAQTVSSSMPYHNLTLSGSGAKTTTGVTVNNVLSLEGTAEATAAITFGDAATLQYNKSAPYTTTNNEFPAAFNGLGGVIITGTGDITFNASKNIAAAPLVITSSTAKVDLGSYTHNSQGLTLGGVVQSTGTSFGSTASLAVNKNNTYFVSPSTGIINVLTPNNTWLGTISTDWSVAGNWSNGIVPTNVSDVIISVSANQPILTANSVCRNLTIDASASLTTAGFQLSITGNYVNNGTAAFGSSSVEFIGAANQAIALFTTTGNILMNKTGGTATLGGAVTANSIILNGTGASLDLGAGFTHTLTGNITITAGTLTVNSFNILLNGTGAQSIGSISTTGNITIAKPSGTATFTGNISAASLIINNAGATLDLGIGLTHTITGNATVSAGILLNNTATLTLIGSGTQNIGPMTGNGTLVVNKTGTANLTGAITIANITVTAGVLNLGAFTHTITGNITGAATLNGESSNIIITGTGAQSIRAITTTGTITTTKTGNTATFTGNITAASLIQNTAGGTLNLGTTLSHNFTTVTITNGTVNGGSSTLTLTGDLVITTPGIFTGNAVNVTATGTANQTIAGFTTTGALSMTKTSNTATLAGSVSVGGLTLNGFGGALNLGIGFTHTVSGTWTRNNGTLNGGNSSLIFTAGNPESGTTGSFIANNGTVTFNAAAQTIPNLIYNNLVLSGSGIKTTSASVIINGGLSLEGTATISSAVTYGLDATLQYNKPGAYLTTNAEFPNTFNGGVYIIGAGTVTLDAAKTINGSLNLSSGATLSLNGFAHQSAGLLLAGVPVTNYGTYGRAGSGATNIDNVYFVSTLGTVDVSNVAITWTGNTSDDWSVASNWSPAISPKSFTDVSIPNVSRKPVLSANSTVKNISIDAGSSLNTNNRQITVFGTFNILGNLSLGSSTVVLAGAVNQNLPTISSTGDFILNKSSGLVTLSGSLVANNIIVNSGGLNLGSGITHTITGEITDPLSGIIYNAADLTFSGTTAQNIAGINTSGTIAINKASNVASFVGNMNIGGLTLTSGTLNLGSGTHTFTGNITQTGGTLNTGTANIIIAGTANQNVTGFATTGAFTMNKTAGTATFTSSMTASTLTINGIGGTLNLGSALNHTFYGDITLTNGTLNGGSSTLNVNSNSATAWSGTGGNFIPASSTVVFGGGIQNIGITTTFNNLTFGGTGAKTIATATTTTVNGVFTIANGANANVYNGTITYGPDATLMYATAGISRTAASEWLSPFVSTGGVVIGGTGAITLNGSKQFGDNTNIPLTINAGATLVTAGFDLTFHGNFVNSGTLSAGVSNINIAGTTPTQNIGNITTLGNLNFTKTSGTATLSGSISSAVLNLNGAGGTLNLGTSLNHTFSGDINLSNGTLNGGSSTINVNSNSTTAWTGTGSNFIAANSTVVIGGTGAQTINTATTFNNLTIGGTGVKSLAFSTTIAGLLTLNNKLSIGSNTMNINGSMNMTSSNSLSFNGSSNIIIGGSGASGTLFFNQTSPGTTNRLANLTYNRNAQTITLGNLLEVKGVVTPTAGTLATGGNLKLISDATGDASIAAGSGSYITGNVTVERFIPASARGWRFMASPVTTSTLQDWQGEFYITGAGGAANGFDATLSNQSGVYSYDETAGGNLNQGWIAPTSITEPLTPGKGFRLFVRGDRTPGRLDGTITTQNAITVNVINPVNTGNINLAPTFTSTGVLANDGWNLKGNPYPSAIDWNAFHDAGRTGSTPDYSGTDYTHLDATVYVLDAGAVAYSSYNAFSGAAVGDLTDGIIPSGAAFWVKASASSPTLVMKEVYKTVSQPGMLFKTGTTNPQFKIQLIASEISYDETVIRYENNATNGFDAYDITKLYGSNVNIASIGSDASFLAANYKPFNGISDSIPLSVGIAQTGSYTLKFIDPDFLHPLQKIFLIDHFLNTAIDVRLNPTYVFNVDKDNAATSGNNRFAIVVSKEVKTSIEPELTNNKQFDKLVLYPTITSDIVKIASQSTQKSAVNIMITDVSGKIQAQYNDMEWIGNAIELDLSAYEAGLYFIRISSTTQNEAVTMKCFKK